MKPGHEQTPVLAAAVATHRWQAGAAEDLAARLALVDRIPCRGVVAGGAGMEGAHDGSYRSGVCVGEAIEGFSEREFNRESLWIWHGPTECGVFVPQSSVGIESTPFGVGLDCSRAGWQRRDARPL